MITSYSFGKSWKILLSILMRKAFSFSGPLIGTKITCLSSGSFSFLRSSSCDWSLSGFVDSIGPISFTFFLYCLGMPRLPVHTVYGGGKSGIKTVFPLVHILPTSVSVIESAYLAKRRNRFLRGIITWNWLRMHIRGFLRSLAASSDEARESETTMSGLKPWMVFTSDMICCVSVKDAKNGPGLIAVLLKSIVPSGFTWNPMAGAFTSGSFSL